MSGEKKGHGNPGIHGHGHKPGRPSDLTNRKPRKTSAVTSKQRKPKQMEVPEVTEKHINDVTTAADHETSAMHSGMESATADVSQAKSEEHIEKIHQEKEEENKKEWKERETESYTDHVKKARTEHKKCNVTPENFNVEEFNTNITEFTRTLDDPRFSQIDSDYPVEDLVTVVTMVTKSVNDYKVHSSESQAQMTDLRDSMRAIKENLHFSITRQALDLNADDEQETQEERELHAKLTQLNSALAQANADVAEAIRLATEAESTAVRANIAAERARAEAERIKDEAEQKEKADNKRREEKTKREAEERRQREENERRTLEEKRKAEEELKRLDAIHSGKAGHVYESWKPVEYEYRNDNGDAEITCIARGQPGSFDKKHVICKVSNEKEALVTYQPNEELISNIVDLTSENGEVELKSPIYVAIPHVLSRTGAQSREAVVKAMSDGHWKYLPSKDVSFDNHKDTKFVQAEVRFLTTLIIVSRLKRDYSTLVANKSHKITSSFDHRITLNVEKNTFGRPEHLLLQVHPVDSGTFQEFRTRQPNGKRLLTCSSMIHTQWDSVSFGKPIEVTVSCPPNPAKAKKMALARKLKDDKMANPSKKTAPIENQEKEKESAKKRLQELLETENGPVKVTKWYMGEYGHSDDDETDKLHFVYLLGGKWFLEPEIVIKQVKVDVLYFRLEFPVDRFIVLRTRTTLEGDAVVTMAAALNEFLGTKFVEAVIRQKSDNPCEVALQVTPVSRRDAVVKQLALQGFESGPATSHVICLQEGDMIEVGFAGNIEIKDEIPEHLIYKSNIPTVTYFTVKEENRFRQKEQDVYSGLIQLTRCYPLTPTKSKKGQGQNQSQNQGQGDENPQQTQKEWKRENMCTIQINIPKYHTEANAEPKKAPILITNINGPVDTDLLMTLAASLGDEWKRVAHFLGVHRARVQAIMRNVTVGERSDREAKYEMLVTWLKGAAKALDKVSALSSALMHSDRYDLAEAVQDRNRDFIEYKRGQLTAAN